MDRKIGLFTALLVVLGLCAAWVGSAAGNDPLSDPPTIAGPDKPVMAKVGVPLKITWRASDPDSDMLTLTAVEGPGTFDTAVGTTKQSPFLVTMTWTPGMADIGIKVANIVVKDPRGHSDGHTVGIRVGP
jgi:hypothetical protein